MSPLAVLGKKDEVLFYALIVLHLLPLWAFEYFPSQDGPSHIFNANLIRVYNHPEFQSFQDYFVPNPRPDPMWFGQLILAGLLYISPFLIAEKILMSFYIIFFPLSVRYALRSINPESEFLSFLAFPFLYNFFFHMGFYSFVFSFVFTFFVIGFWMKKRDGFKGNDIIVMAVLSLLLYFTHVFSFVLVCLTIGFLTIWLIIIEGVSKYRSGKNLAKDLWVLSKTKGLKVFLAFLPALFIFGLFLFPREVISVPGKSIGVRLYDLFHLMSLSSFDTREIWITSVFAFFLGFILTQCSVRHGLKDPPFYFRLTLEAFDHGSHIYHRKYLRITRSYLV